MRLYWTGFGFDAIRGKTTYSGGVSYNNETGKGSVSLGAKTKNVGANIALSAGDGEIDADLGVSGKIAKASIGGTYINKDEKGVVESELLNGQAYSQSEASFVAYDQGGVRVSRLVPFGGPLHGGASARNVGVLH